MPFPRYRALAVTGAIGGVAFAFAVPMAATASAATAPPALVAASLTAAGKESAVHFDAYSQRGKESIAIVADAATSTGRQSVTIRKGKSTGHVQSRLVGGDAYFEGDSYGLTAYLGMPSTLAPKYAGKWIVFTPSDQSFSQIEQNFTVGTAVGEIQISKPMAIASHAAVDGTSAITVKGTTKALSTNGKSGPASLSVKKSRSPLPVRFIGHSGPGGTKTYGRIDYSHWGSAFTVAKPTGAIPASAIKA
jgi:hypothetical protein